MTETVGGVGGGAARQLKPTRPMLVTTGCGMSVKSHGEGLVRVYLADTVEGLALLFTTAAAEKLRDAIIEALGTDG